MSNASSPLNSLLVPSRDRTYYKRARRTNVRKATNGSYISSLSALTMASVGSNDSNATITQRSVTNSRRSKHATSSNRSRKHGTSNKTSQRQPQREKSFESTLDQIDVFDFLEDPHEKPSPRGHKRVDTGTDLFAEDDYGAFGLRRDSQSDSGISVGDSSPDPVKGSSSMNVIWPSVRDGGPFNALRASALGTLDHPPSTSYRDASGALPGLSSPTQNPVSILRNNSFPHKPPTGEASPPMTPNSSDFSPRSGYDLLASLLASSMSPTLSVPPAIYRKFSHLNHRVLLQLQDELSQMEEDLARLDEADALSRQRKDGSLVPESRRCGWQWDPSGEKARRLDLLGQIAGKVQQYNHAFTSFQDFSNSTNSATESSIYRYRTWLKEYAPIAREETRFLDYTDDLLEISSLRQGRHLQRLSDLLALRGPPETLIFLAVVALLGFLVAKIPLILFLFLGLTGTALSYFRGAVPQKKQVEA